METASHSSFSSLAPIAAIRGRQSHLSIPSHHCRATGVVPAVVRIVYWVIGAMTRRRSVNILPFLAKRNTQHGSQLGRWRWVVERSFAWLNQFRRLRVRYEKRADIHEAFLSLGCILICQRFFLPLRRPLRFSAGRSDSLSCSQKRIVAHTCRHRDVSTSNLLRNRNESHFYFH